MSQSLTSSLLHQQSELYYPPREFMPSQALPESKNLVWLIQGGVVKTQCLNEEGFYTTLGYWKSGEVIGRLLLMNEFCQAVCITKVIAQCVSINDASNLTAALISQLKDTQQLLAIQSMKRVCQRCQHAFLWLATRFGQDTDSGTLVNLPMTHDAIAELIGTSRVSITRLMNELSDKGILFRDKRLYTLTKTAFQKRNWFD